MLTKVTAFALLLLAGTGATWADEAPSKPLVAHKPVKVSAADAAGPIFATPAAVADNGPDGPARDVLLLRSKDKRVEMGLYDAGPVEIDIASYPDDEFMYFLAGGVTLTSADGTVLEVKAGEGVAMPRGWKGHWSTKGYRKYYVTYTTP
jgi:uncharacterized cupin superfamily protein